MVFQADKNTMLGSRNSINGNDEYVTRGKGK